MESRRTFTKEFKAETVALVEQQGLSIHRVAKDMSLTWSQVNDGKGNLKKGGGLLCQGKRMRFDFIAVEKANFPVAVLCRAMKVPPSGFYAWVKSRHQSARRQVSF